MKTEIKKSDFKDLRTAVCYYKGDNGFKFIPTVNRLVKIDLSYHSNCRVLYLGNNEKLENNDFAQYDFSYLIKKEKFNDKLLINQLTDESLNLIGSSDIDILSSIENRIFPSNLNINPDPYPKYFGSSTFNSSKFFSINLWRGVYKIELYEEVIETNHNIENTEEKFYEFGIFDISIDHSNFKYTSTPAIIVTLGPDNTLKNNDDNWYYDSDSLKNNRENLISLIDYRKYTEEVDLEKTVNIFIPESSISDSKVNISLNSWKDDNKNPNRNTHKYLIRNDEFYSEINNILPIKKLSNNLDLVYDVNTMTLVGNTKLDNFGPIYKSKKSEEINNRIWVPSVRYNFGEEVKIEGIDNITWTSLIDNNIGNNPLISSSWENIEELINFTTSNIGIYIDETKYQNIGKIYPNNIRIITEDTKYLEINAVSATGFDIKHDSILIYPKLEDKEELKLELDDYSYYITQDLGHMFIFKDKQINNLRNLKYLYIKCEPKEFPIGFKVREDTGSGVIEVPWSTWSENNNTTLIITSDSIPGSIELGKDNLLRLSTRDVIKNIKLSGDNIDYYKLTGLLDSNNTYFKSENNEINNITILPTEEEDMSNLINYIIFIEDKVFNVSVTKLDNFIVDNPIKKILLNNPCEIKFYLQTENTDLKEIVIKSNNDIVKLDINNNQSSVFGGITLSKVDDIFSLRFNKITNNIDIELLYENK